MSHSEWIGWCLFRERFGDLHVGMRIDRAVARAIVSYVRMNSKNNSIKEKDFSPFDQVQKNIDINDIGAVFAALSGS